ncbi:MAG: hypothetical protein ABL930_07360 [Pseudobdellovibrio sp.]
MLAFNNCSQQKLSSGADESASINLSTFSSDLAALQAVDAAIYASGVADAEIKLFVAPSLNGPWVENGSVCRGQAAYFKTTGIKQGSAVKGCASTAADKGCFDLNKHRDFLASEMVGGNIVTSLSAAQTGSYPVTDYSFYVSLIGEKTIILQKSGSSKIVQCGDTQAPAQAACSWKLQNPTAVVGGGRNVYPSYACINERSGQVASGYYDMGSGNTLAQSYKCTCE